MVCKLTLLFPNYSARAKTVFYVFGIETLRNIIKYDNMKRIILVIMFLM